MAIAVIATYNLSLFLFVYGNMLPHHQLLERHNVFYEFRLGFESSSTSSILSVSLWFYSVGDSWKVTNVQSSILSFGVSKLIPASHDVTCVWCYSLHIWFYSPHIAGAVVVSLVHATYHWLPVRWCHQCMLLTTYCQCGDALWTWCDMPLDPACLPPRLSSCAASQRPRQ